jgi:hypothetical protein
VQTSEVIMNSVDRENKGIQMMLTRYKKIFRIPENTDYYSETDFKIAEKKFLKLVLQRGKYYN